MLQMTNCMVVLRLRITGKLITGLPNVSGFCERYVCLNVWFVTCMLVSMLSHICLNNQLGF